MSTLSQNQRQNCSGQNIGAEGSVVFYLLPTSPFKLSSPDWTEGNGLSVHSSAHPGVKMQRRQDESQCRSAYFPLPAIQKGHGDQLTSEHREKWNKFLFRQAVFSISALSTQTSQASVKRYCFHFPSDSISFQTFCSSTWFSLVGQQQWKRWEWK